MLSITLRSTFDLQNKFYRDGCIYGNNLIIKIKHTHAPECIMPIILKSERYALQQFQIKMKYSAYYKNISHRLNEINFVRQVLVLRRFDVVFL